MTRRRPALHGVLVIDKPAGMSSSDVVEEVRRRTRIKAAGHTGTLDPMATGVLPICVGAITKLAQWLLADDKAYEAELELGFETDTHDAEGAVTRRDPEAAARVDEPGLRAALAGFVGVQDQVPPMHSAIKHDGFRLHELARLGMEVERAPREIKVERLELVSFDPPRARLAMACSKGTYVRGLVRDLGVRLGCGACLTALRRTASGRFTLADAVPLAAVDRHSVAGLLMPASRATGLPSVTIAAAHLRDVRDGRRLDPAVFAPGITGRFQMLDEAGDVIAIAEPAGDHIHFHRVLTYDGGNSTPRRE